MELTGNDVIQSRTVEKVVVAAMDTENNNNNKYPDDVFKALRGGGGGDSSNSGTHNSTNTILNPEDHEKGYKCAECQELCCECCMMYGRVI